jgi:Tfp pilus assembly protein PilF
VDLQRAVQLGALIREKDPDDPTLRHELGCTYLRMGKKEQALHWFRTALEKNPAHRPTHESLAAYYEKDGRLDRAGYHRQFLQNPGGANRAESPQ